MSDTCNCSMGVGCVEKSGHKGDHWGVARGGTVVSWTNKVDEEQGVMDRVDKLAVEAIMAESTAIMNLFMSVTEEFNLHNFDRITRQRVWQRLEGYVMLAYIHGEGHEGNPFPHAPVDGMWNVSPSPTDSHGESDDLVMIDQRAFQGDPVNAYVAPAMPDPELDRLLAEEEEIERAAELIRLHQEQELHNEEE